MAGNSDGSVIIDTSLDLDGIEKAAKEFLKAVDDMVSKGNKIFNGFVVHVDGIEEAEKDLDILNQRIKDLADDRMDIAKTFEEASQAFGEDSEQANALREALDKLDESIRINTEKADGLTSAINKAKDAKQKATQTTKEYGNAASDAAGKTQKLSNEQGKTEKSIGSMQIALGNLVSRGIEKTISSIGDLLDKTKDLRRQMAMLETNSEMAGIDMEVTEEAMKRLNVVTEDTDSQLEAVSNLLAAGVDENQLMQAVDALSGAVVKLPSTMRIENIAESLQETVATSKPVGQFAELLDRCGIDVEYFTTRLEGMGSESGRLNLVLETLSETGLAKFYETYRDRNPDLVEGANAQHEYNQTLVALSEILQPLETELMKEFTNLITENKDTIQALADVLLFLLDGILQIFSVVANMPPELLTFLIILGGVITLCSKMDSALGGTGDALKGVTGGIKTFAKALDGSYNSVYQWVVLIGVGIAVLSLMLYLILAIGEGTEKAGQAMENFKMPSFPTENLNINPNRNPYFKNYPGYAKGTQSAGRGWRLVGEQGPELLYLRGGEKILTASQSMAWNAAYGGRIPDRALNQTINLNVNGIDQMNEVVNWYTNRQQMARAR